VRVHSQGCQVGNFNAKLEIWPFQKWKSGLTRENAVWHVRYNLARFWRFFVVLAEKKCLAF